MDRIGIPTTGLLLLAMLSTAGAVDVPPPGAAGCSGCHPLTRWTGTSVTRLSARPAAEIVAAMQEFRAGKRPGTIMDRIAKGFTDDEIRAIAAWYAAQRE